MTVDIHIDVLGDKAIGMDGLILGQPLSDIYLNDQTLIEDGQKFDRMWIKDCMGANINNNTNNIKFVEYYPTSGSNIYYKNIKLLRRTLNHDIHELLKYSYLFVEDCDSFYFPMINICIWTNKDIDKPGYSLGIYNYGTYDEYSNPIDMTHINNTSNRQIGEIIDNTNYYTTVINTYIDTHNSDNESNSDNCSNSDNDSDNDSDNAAEF